MYRNVNSRWLKHNLINTADKRIIVGIIQVITPHRILVDFGSFETFFRFKFVNHSHAVVYPKIKKLKAPLFFPINELISTYKFYSEVPNCFTCKFNFKDKSVYASTFESLAQLMMEKSASTEFVRASHLHSPQLLICSKQKFWTICLDVYMIC